MTPLQKHQAIRNLLREDAIWQEAGLSYNCLPPELREKYDIVDTPNVSAHEYDPYANEIVRRFESGWVLDCGAGSRGDYRPNVVNYEIVAYPSTNVLGVAEELPFKDETFDGVLCLNVLEHVKDPFKAAREIARVMKPGGRLYCVVPFLQQVHGYPHHYYNMTAQGLKNLFSGTLNVDRQLMLASGLPIWTLTAFLRSWAAGLPEDLRAEFLNKKVSDLVGDPVGYLEEPFVRRLPDDKNFELASTTAILATKPAAGTRDA
jgi:SAM-dependent methyltransferase